MRTVPIATAAGKTTKFASVISSAEAIRLLKAETLAPDWRLSMSRILALEPAFEKLIQEFSDRPDAVSVVIMARNVLSYVKRHNQFASYDCLSFFKEAMAHAVSLYEVESLEADYDAKVFRAAYGRFQALKRKLPVPLRELEDDKQAKKNGQVIMPEEPEAEDCFSNVLLEQEDQGMRQAIAALALDVQRLGRQIEKQGHVLAGILARLEKK